MKTTELVFNYLKEQGLVPKFNDRGNIEFKYQMRNFLFFNNDEDNQFINLTMPRIYDVTDDNRFAVFEAINDVMLFPYDLGGFTVSPERSGSFSRIRSENFASISPGVMS